MFQLDVREIVIVLLYETKGGFHSMNVSMELFRLPAEDILDED